MKLSDENYKVFYRRLKAYLSPKVQSSEDVDDLIQDILIKLSLNLNSLRESEKIISWMYRIAHNTLVDFYRAKNMKNNNDGGEEGNENPEENFNNEFTKCIQPLLIDLPPKYSRAIEMIEMQGMSQKEYARRYNLSDSGAKSQIQRARKLVKKSIEQCCGPITDSYGNIVDAKITSCNCEKK